MRKISKPLVIYTSSRMRLVGALLAAWLPVTAALADTTVVGMRSWAAPDHTRVVLDLTAPVHYKMFSLRNPERVVLDLYDARLRAKPPAPWARDRYLKRIRSGKYKERVRIVLDLKTQVRPRSFLLAPYQDYGHRLVVDLHSVLPAPTKPPVRPPAAPVIGKQPVERTAKAPSPPLRAAMTPSPRPVPVSPAERRNVIIAIDPGHGGDDPGATGSAGHHEKHVVMQIAHRLHTLIKREPGMSAFLVRDGDYYVKLSDRVHKARKRNADLFISIHADAFRDPRVRGSSVYVLSRKGASSEMARQLADRENAADLIGGVSIADKDELLAAVIVDLQQTAVMSAAIDAAREILKGLNAVGKVRKRALESANFRVLRAPDIPSILIETGYITNPQEEKRLADPAYQERLVQAILRGLRRYFLQHAPQDSLLAAARDRGA